MPYYDDDNDEARFDNYDYDYFEDHTFLPANKFIVEHCVVCEHARKDVSKYEDHILTCTYNGDEYEDPSSWLDCPIMVAEFHRETTCGSKCDMKCPYISYLLLDGDDSALRNNNPGCSAENCQYGAYEAFITMVLSDSY